MSKLRFLLQDFISFVKHPSNLIRTENKINQNIIEVGIYYGIITVVIGASLGLFRYFLEEFSVIESVELSKSVKDMMSNISLMFLLTIVVAPILEESIFRGFLGSFIHKNYFKWLYYLSALLFGLVHTSNYELTESQNLLIPLIILPQLFLGFILGFVRNKYGFFYCVLLHAIYNGCLVSIYTIGEIFS
ncbi:MULTISPECIES: CPBP family intramembrane glutamic endopeptidase [Emticicia]|uniref:CPBP family intramembrane glutamic endopeptidase n=1 Tax=Emticicia TaxID=312278 RepID=UPI0007D8BE42|nr:MULTISPECIES: CPBP family intramembrane glutamic endopeptidase [Emticicia]